MCFPSQCFCFFFFTFWNDMFLPLGKTLLLPPAESVVWLKVSTPSIQHHLVFISSCATEKQKFLLLFFFFSNHNRFHFFFYIRFNISWREKCFVFVGVSLTFQAVAPPPLLLQSRRSRAMYCKHFLVHIQETKQQNRDKNL